MINAPWGVDGGSDGWREGGGRGDGRDINGV